MKYKIYKNKLTNILRYCEREYYNKSLELHKKYIKRTWKILNEVINKRCKSNSFSTNFIEDGIEITNKQEIAEGKKKFFVNIGPELARNIVPPEHMDIYHYLDNLKTDSMFLFNVNKKEIIDIVNSFENKLSKDKDGFNMYIMKKIVNQVVDPFLHICNLSFNKGIFPDAMKVAKVIPIHKSGEKNVFNNYRPVSILSRFSKILERLFCNRLENYIEKNKILNDSQYGFRNHRSTAMAIIDLIEYVTTALDKKKHVMGIFIDLKKAFDTIDHEILMKKLYHYGLRGISQKWIQSYLSQRKQFVEYDEVKSSCKDIVCGIPQGSILGPKLFILYINDICNVSTLLKYVLFADDTNLLYEHENYETLCMNVNNELSKLNEWFSINKLSLNVKKTNFMVFGNKHIIETLKIRINNEDIVKVIETKFSGIYIDFRLNWKKTYSEYIK